MNIRLNILILYSILFVLCSFFNDSFPQNNSKTQIFNKSKLFALKGDTLKSTLPDSATYYYQKAIQLLDTTPNGKSDKKILFNKSVLLSKIGQIFFQQSKYEFCEDYYKQALESAKLSENDSIIAECFFNMGEYCLENGNYSSAVNSYLEAIKYYEKRSDSEGIFWSNIGLGIIFKELGNKDLSILHAEKARKIAKENNNKLYVAISNNNISSMYLRIGEYETALKFLINSLKSFEEYGDKKLLSDCYENIGNVYEELNDVNRSIEYFLLSKNLAEKIDDKYRLLSRYANLANSYSLIGDNENALMYFSKTLELAQSIGDKARLSEIFIMLSNFYKKNNDLINARNYLDKSLDNSREIGDTLSIVSTLNLFSELCLLESNFKKSLQYANEAYTISRKKNLLKLVSESSNNLAKAYSKLGDYKSAYKFLEVHKSVKDSLLNLEKLKVLEDTQAKYKLEQLESDKLKAENDAIITEAQVQNRNLLILILVILILVSLFIFGTYFIKKRNERKEAKEKASRLTKKIDLLSTQLSIKNRELTTKALLISSNNKTKGEIVESIDEFLNNPTEDKSSLRKLRNRLQSITEEESWTDFLQHFQEVHPTFYKNLTQKYSSLTSSEQKICAFLKMNLNTKEIAQITNQTTKSIEVARTRIRKKLEVDRGISLTQAIHNL